MIDAELYVAKDKAKKLADLRNFIICKDWAGHRQGMETTFNSDLFKNTLN